LVAWTLVFAVGPSIATALERPGDSANADELRRRTIAAAAVQKDFLALIEAAPSKEKFELYRTYDESMGTWVNVGFLRSVLDDAIAAQSWTIELKLRADLRDQARYAVWEIDQNIAHLDERIEEEKRARHLRLTKALRSALLNVRATVTRLAAEQ
jgi:hypothetical protein